MGGQTWNHRIISLNTASYVRFGHIDSVFFTTNNYWVYDTVAKKLFYGDTINSVDAVWQNSFLLQNDNQIE
jgi:hypothetical protein